VALAFSDLYCILLATVKGSNSNGGIDTEARDFLARWTRFEL
jgi:hypothetical protein